MKKYTINLLLLFLFLNLQLFSQSESNSYTFNSNKYDGFVVKIDTSAINHFSIAENNTYIKHKDLLDSIPKDDWFLTIASIVDTACMPLGLYISEQKKIKNVNLSNGSGNFFLKPNGILYFSDNDINICQSNNFSGKGEVKYAIQSGPLLINNSNINSKFNVNSTSKFIRSGVGIYKNNKGEKFIVFAISKQPVNFYSFADFFLTKLNCTNALCLESQRSVMSIPFFPNNTDNSEKIICRYIIFKN